jgi:putative transposase
LRIGNTPQTAAEEASLRLSIQRSRPFGSDSWVRKTAQKLKMQQSLNPRGRPVGWRKQRDIK